MTNAPENDGDQAAQQNENPVRPGDDPAAANPADEVAEAAEEPGQVEAAERERQPAQQEKAPTEHENPALLGTAKKLAISLAAVVILAFVLITTFTLQVFPFAPERTDACDMVDKISDTLGTIKNPADAVKTFGGYLADKDIRRAMLICDIERENVTYERTRVTNQILSSIGTVLVIVLTLATSFILGAGWTANSPSLKAVTVALPLISAALTALMSEFHLSDVWQLREIGGIESRMLRDRAFDLDITSANFDEKFSDIRHALVKLERDQAERYFAYKFRTRDAEEGGEPPPDPNPKGTQVDAVADVKPQVK